MVYQEFQSFVKKAKGKVVLSGANGTWRCVYSNPRTSRQVAVVSCFEHEPEGHITEWSDFKVCVPVEGRGGWTVYCRTITEVAGIVDRECSKRGKLFNRLVAMPWFFLKGGLE